MADLMADWPVYEPESDWPKTTAELLDRIFTNARNRKPPATVPDALRCPVIRTDLAKPSRCVFPINHQDPCF